MPEPVKIVCEAKQQSLTALGQQTTARSAAGKFSFDGREDCLHDGTPAVEMAWEMVAHLGTDAMKMPGFLAAFSGNDAARSQALADVRVVEFAVELGIGQDQTDSTDGVGGIQEGAQISSVVGGSSVSLLGQKQLLVQINCHQPFQPVPPRHGLLVVVVHAADKESTDGAGAETSSIGGHRSPTSGTGQRHAMNDFIQRTSNGRLIQTPQEAVQSRVVRNRSQAKSAAQLRVLSQTDFGFPIRPVLVAHEAQDGQQLWLREFVFAKCRAISRHGGLGHVQGHLREAHQTHFGHDYAAKFAPAKGSLPPFAAICAKGELRMSTEPSGLINGVANLIRRFKPLIPLPLIGGPVY
jgi:hypothetical protein